MREFDATSCEPQFTKWHAAALVGCRSPAEVVECPNCKADDLAITWHMTDPLSREAEIEARCSSCGAAANFTMVLPPDVLPFFPPDRYVRFAAAVSEHADTLAKRVYEHARAMPAAAFTAHPLWGEARWSATTFQWHPTSEAPPIMGLVFDNAEAGREIFREAEGQMNHTDRFEEIRISIVEGTLPGAVLGQAHRPGYSVHICPDPEALAMHATGADFVVDPHVVPFLGQWNRHYPIPGQPALLPRFKREFDKHKEFMLAPVTRRADGQLYADPELGIIKNLILFRDLSEITADDDPDAAAVMLPQLITPPALNFEP